MFKPNKLFRLSFFGAIIVVSLAACAGDAVIDDEGYYAFAPPLNEREVRQYVANPMTEIWRPGYWAPAGYGKYEWVPGAVIARPSPTAVWSSARWVRRTYGWTFQEGHWE